MNEGFLKARMSENNTTGQQKHPLLELNDEEREFVLRLVLASGSLKELAKLYAVSYPTIRARLDRLIERLRTFVDQRPADPMANLLADFVEQSQLTAGAARQILDLHRERLSTEGNDQHG